MSPGKTEVKQNKFVEFISLRYFRETNKSQNINVKRIFQTPKFTLGIIQIEVKGPSTRFQCIVKKIN